MKDVIIGIIASILSSELILVYKLNSQFYLYEILFSILYLTIAYIIGYKKNHKKDCDFLLLTLITLVTLQYYLIGFFSILTLQSVWFIFLVYLAGQRDQLYKH